MLILDLPRFLTDFINVERFNQVLNLVHVLFLRGTISRAVNLKKKKYVIALVIILFVVSVIITYLHTRIPIVKNFFF